MSNELPKGTVNFGFLLLFLAGTILLNQAVTQWVGWQFDYQEALGGLAIGSFAVYLPWQWVEWTWKFGAVPDAVQVFVTARWLFGMCFAVWLIVSIACAAFFRRMGVKKAKKGYSSGWANEVDIAYSELALDVNWLSDKEVKKIRAEHFKGEKK